MTLSGNHRSTSHHEVSAEKFDALAHVREYVTDVTYPQYHTTGTLHNDAAVMKDGTAYAVLRAVPHEPITDIVIGLTPAWWTSTRGHNRHTIEHFMRLGVPGIAIGIEGSYRGAPQETVLQEINGLRQHSLLRSSHHMHRILDAIESKHETLSVHTQDMILLGESRGAMIGKGILGLASEYDRNIPYADLTAPCFPEKFSITKTPNLVKQIAYEPLEFIKMFGSISLRSLIHYPASIDLHPRAIANNIAIGPALFSGDAGLLAGSIPLEQNMHITTFHDDFASMPDAWEDIYEEHQNVRIKRIEGAHLTIAHSRTLEYIDRRIFALLLEIEHVGSKNAEDLDFSKVHLHDE
jgi:hypothetical protein